MTARQRRRLGRRLDRMARRIRRLDVVRWECRAARCARVWHPLVGACMRRQKRNLARMYP